MTTTLPLRAHVADGRYTVSTIELIDPTPVTRIGSWHYATFVTWADAN
ncbi:MULTISPECIES: hypothetical protein [Streptomyces]|nr:MULTISPECIES: hypothetical protein [Streptomyces]MDX3064365.1 hypothetical protein [Streptomyces sp. ND04-05B]MDX3519665.1 hypothetical protein [Streptomyces scabiei]